MLTPDPYLTKPYAPADQRLRDFTAWLEQVPVATSQIRSNLRTPMPRTWIDQGVASFGGMVGFLRDDAPAAFADVKDPALQKAYAEATQKAVAALKELSDWLTAQRSTQTEDYAIGAELFAAMLKRTEGVDVSARAAARSRTGRPRAQPRGYSMRPARSSRPARIARAAWRR